MSYRIEIKFNKITVEYVRGETPVLTLTGNTQFANKDRSLIAISNSAHVIAIACNTSVALYSGLTGELDTVISHIFNDGCTAMKFDPTGKLLFLAGDKQVRVFHNITGYKVDNEVAKSMLKQNQTNATKERLNSQIANYEEFIKNHAE